MTRLVPQQPRTQTISLLSKHGVDVSKRVALLGVRGYYRDTMGEPGQNDLGIYDDAIFVVSPDTHKAFHANTDPSRLSPGMASLLPGVWKYQLGLHGLSKPLHQRYLALVQAAPVTVARHLQRTTDTGWFGINIHRGGRNTTSSAGCQTIPPELWDAFLPLVRNQLREYKQEWLHYVLMDGPTR